LPKPCHPYLPAPWLTCNSLQAITYQPFTRSAHCSRAHVPPRSLVVMLWSSTAHRHRRSLGLLRFFFPRFATHPHSPGLTGVQCQCCGGASRPTASCPVVFCLSHNTFFCKVSWTCKLGDVETIVAVPPGSNCTRVTANVCTCTWGGAS